MGKTILKILIWILVLSLLGAGIWYCFFYNPFAAEWIIEQYADFSYEHNQFERAGKAYGILTSYDSDNPDCYLKASQAFVLSGNYTKAEYYLFQGIEAFPEDISCYLSLSSVFVEEDKLLDAEKLISGCEIQSVKDKLNAMRPAAPQIQPDEEYSAGSIECSLSFDGGIAYYSTTKEYPSVSGNSYSGAFSLDTGVTTVSAIVVGDNGLVSPLSQKTFTVRGAIEVLSITDDAFNSYLHDLLDMDLHEEILTSMVWDIEELNILSDVKDLSPLSAFVGLKKLTLNSCGSDITPVSNLLSLDSLTVTNTALSQESLSAISGLSSLTSLTLSSCSLENIDFLSSLSGLTYLDLSDNVISDISALAAVSGLQELYLQGNTVSSISSLAALSSLRILNVSGNKIYSLGALSANTILEQLSAENCSLSDLAPLVNKGSLTYLAVSANNITSLDSLSNCLYLQELYVAENQITDCNSITALTYLKILDISENLLDSCPAFSDDNVLAKLNLSGNNVQSISSLKNLYSLNYLDVSSNHISDLTPVSELPELVEVTAYFNAVDGSVDALESRSIIVNYTKGYEFPPEELSLDDFGSSEE